MANQMQTTTGQRSVTKEQWLNMISNKIDEELISHKSALPAGFNRVRFTMNCTTMLQDMMKKEPQKLQVIQPNTIAMCMVKGAYLGLDFFNGECYAIPYGKEMNFQTDYKGEIKLCKKYSSNPIKDIYAKLVRDGDFFEESVEGGVPDIRFKAVPFSDAEVKGAFAVVLFKDGSMLYESMSVAEIELIRKNFSKAGNSPAWTKTPGEMYKKTVLRRLCKSIDLNFDTIEARKAFDDAGDSAFDDSFNSTGDESAPVDVFAESRELEPEAEGQRHPMKGGPKAEKTVQNATDDAMQADFAAFDSQYNSPIDPDAGELPY